MGLLDKILKFFKPGETIQERWRKESWYNEAQAERARRFAEDTRRYEQKLAYEAQVDRKYWQEHEALYPGGSSKSPEWNQMKRQVLSRDHYRCVNCGREGRFPHRKRGQPFVKSGPYVGLHVHHIQPLSRGGTNSFSNLQTLCKQCHEQVHGRPLEGKRNR